MANTREVCLMEGRFFIEIGQFTNGASAQSRDGMESNGQDVEGDSDDEEETRENNCKEPPDVGTDDDDVENESAPQHLLLHDSGIDSFLLLETGTPASEENEDEGDEAFRPVVYSKRRRGSRGREVRSESEPVGEAAKTSSQLVKSDADGSENDAALETNKQRKRKKKRNKKRAADALTDGLSTDWDQLDLIDDDFGVSGTAEETTKKDLSSLSEAIAETTDVKSAENSSKSALQSTESGGFPVKKNVKDDVFVVGKISNGFHQRSFSESYESKAGIKSILKNRSRTFSGESSCSETAEWASSCGGKSNGCRSRDQSTTSLTDVTQSMESLSITSVFTSDSCCEEGHEDARYCASSWSAGGTRKSVHFSSVIDRKRFRSGAPPSNVGKGRRNSGGKVNGCQNQAEHGKKRHMSEGDAATMMLPEDGVQACDFSRGGNGAKAQGTRGGRGDSPTSDVMSASSDELFEMEELDEAEQGKTYGSPLGNVPEEVEDQKIILENGNHCGTKSKRSKKNKSKKGKGKASKPEMVASEFHEEKEGWSIVGGSKLGWKKSGPGNSSDLSLFSDVDDGHSISATEGCSDFGAISITNG